MTAGDTPRGVATIALALAVFLAAFTTLALCVGPAPLHADTARDLLLALDCTRGGRWLLHGPTASLPGFVQGASWIHLLAACGKLGMGITGVRMIVLAMHALAATVMYFVPRRSCAIPGGAAVCAAYLAASALGAEYPVLWNPSALALPLVLFYVSLLALAARGESLAAVTAGATLALAIDAHLVCAGLLPLLLLVAAASARRPVLATLAAVFAVLGTYAMVSPGALLANLPALRSHAPVLSAMVVLSTLAGMSLRGRASALREIQRSRATVLIAFGGAVVAAIVALATHHRLEPRYLAPAAPVVALVLGGLPAMALARVKLSRPVVETAAAVLVGIAAFFAAREPARAAYAWTIADAEILARELYVTRGYSFRDVMRRLRGPEAYPLVLTLAALEPGNPAGGREHEPLRDDLLVIATERTRVPASHSPDWTLLDLPGARVAIVRRGHSALDYGAMEVCARGRCASVNLTDEDPDRGAARDLSHRAYLQFRAFRQVFSDESLRGAGPLRWSAVLPVRLAPGEPAHVLRVLGRPAPWRVVSVVGAQTAGEALPAQQVTITAGQGTVEFAAEIAARDASRFERWTPPIVEVTPSESALLGLLPPEQR